MNIKFWIAMALFLAAAPVPPPFAQIKPVICAAEEKDFLDRDCVEADFNL